MLVHVVKLLVNYIMKCHYTAVCIDLAKSEWKAVYMNIIMYRASHSG